MQLLFSPFLLFSCTTDRPNPLPSTRFSSLPSILQHKLHRIWDCLGEIPRFQKVGIDGSTLRPPQIKSRKRRREESPLPDIFEGMEYGVADDLGSTRTSAGVDWGLHRIAIFLKFSCERPDIALGMIIFYDMPNEIRVI